MDMARSEATDGRMISYLDGEEFSETANFAYDFETPLQNRRGFLTGLAAGKRVLHVGCCDHISLIPDKIAAGQWLHGNLTNAASYCLGVDIDAEAVRHAIRHSRLDNIVCGDITREPRIPAIADKVFDYAIFADVIEHIGNPVQFLTAFLSLYGDNIRHVAITVPNSLWFGNISNGLKSRELINSDHRSCFTPYALSKVAWDAGLAPVSLHIVNYGEPNFLKRAVLNQFPMLGGGIAYVGAPRARR